ncbi:MAG: carbohydrate ABC transporter permease [Halanaerobiales bacterium]
MSNIEYSDILYRFIYYALLVIFCTFFSFPILWLIFAPFNSDPSLSLEIPLNPTISNFAEVLSHNHAMNALLNSLIQSIGSTTLVIILASLAAYAFSRVNLPGKTTIIYLMVLFSSIVVGIAAMVPIYFLLLEIGMVDTHLGVILVFTGGFLPTGIFLLKDFIDDISTTYEESAIIVGASKFQIFKDIIFPLSTPGMVVVGVFCFAQIWSNFLIPFLLLRSQDMMPASVAIYTFTDAIGMPDLGLISAYSFIYTIPIILIYLYTSKKYGFRFYGGLKG